MNENQINLINEVLHSHGVRAALVCNPGRSGVGRWLLNTKQIPILPPFGRGSMIVVYDDKDPVMTCALQPHPTDPEQFPVFSAGLLEGYVTDGAIGVINGDCLKQKVLDRLVDSFAGVKLIDLSKETAWLQAEHTGEDAELMSAAARRYDRLFSAVPMLLSQERLETDVVLDIRYRALQLGMEAEDLGLLTQVWLTSGRDGAAFSEDPIMWPGKRLEWGDRVNVSVAGYTPEGVCTALGRCYVLGTANESTRLEWEAALQVQDAAAACLKPGSTLSQAVAAAESAANEAGLTLAGNLWLHGIGWGWQELPRTGDSSAELPLEENMTILVAPRLTKGDKMPYCPMDIFRVTEQGGVRLSSVSRELAELG